MEFPSPFDIKQEIIDIEYQDKNDQFLEFTYNVKVKVEDRPQLFEDVDWCIEKEISQLNRDYSNVDYGHEYKEKCSRCNSVFSDNFSLLHHNLTHLRINLSSCLLNYKHKCDICFAYYQTRKELESHNIKHCNKEKKIKECTICQKMFTYKKLHAHMKVAHSHDEYHCGECNTKFKCAQYLRRHLLYHHGDAKPSWRYHSVSDTEVKCPHCPNIFKNKSALTTHIRNCHSGSHECKVCGSKLKSHSYLLTHMLRVHYNDGKKHKCMVCGENFKSPRYLRVHMKYSQHLLFD